MIGNLEHTLLQQLWWLIASVVGSLFLMLTFVQGGQTLIFTTAKSEEERSLIINSIGRKWELTFTTLVLFGGALFAAFPLFYATSFGGAYWVWMLILFTFIGQAVSFEYRKKPDNVLGAKIYEIFMLINGTVGILLIGAAVGTFFTGSSFTLTKFNSVIWDTPFRGLEAALNVFNVAFGLFLVFLARVLGAMYIVNHIHHDQLVARARKATLINLVFALPFLLTVLGGLLTMDGFAIDPNTGKVFMEKAKYLHNLLAMPAVPVLLLLGLVSVIYGVVATAFLKSNRGIWFGGLGTVLVGLAVFCLAGYNNTAFYPSVTSLQSSLTIYNASSSKYTLTVMSYVAIGVPFVLAYIAYVWRLMDARQLTLAELAKEENY
ncbi:cytochrome d ubiquinol oxidase subunit II [Geomesophilobacter sediminis]|uniref:Cytochrome d ubiquinol oxidase subunit II n=1 Tax=Geomesophilobacter sediminis TaxID=2798584 RepID=A0A8J7JD55_9BACT|nr:cytochrome d ubiquinol oxidase subunit II [Geomesophilobacter sediminis]MBJ6723369.1 cytochrome d ubiquinol oxidase subunit II [Geomesophilobacter sediminis]